MKINSPNISKIIIELTEKDMLELDITYENMDYSNIETRRVIWTLLDKARKELKRDIDISKNMTIETVPAKHGGCVIFFTASNEKTQRKKIAQKDEKVYEFDSIDNFIDLLASIRDDFPHGDLYSDDSGKFRFIVPSEEYNEAEVCFREYSHLCRENKLAAEITKEHWTLKSVNFCFSAKR